MVQQALLPTDSLLRSHALGIEPEHPLPRPPRIEEWLGARLFLALSPRLRDQPQPPIPDDLGTFRAVALPRGEGQGSLSGTWYPTNGRMAKGKPVKGVVVLLPPWTVWGQAYFLRRNRIQALREAGYHALTLDLPGFGASGKPWLFFDRDLEEALATVRERTVNLPLFVWGVSAGGYWAHPAMARLPWVRGAFFEDVAPHLLEWGWRNSPWSRPFFLFFRFLLPRAHRFLDLRNHAPGLRGRSVAYVTGACDLGVPAKDASKLASLAGAQHHLVPRAGHLASIKIATREVISLALATFERAL